MKNKKYICLLIYNLITCHLNATDLNHDKFSIVNTFKTNNNDVIDNNNLKKPYKTIIEDMNTNCKKVTTEMGKDGYLSIKNSNLNCSLVSLIHCLNKLDGTYDNLVSNIRCRYNNLNYIQYTKTNYSVFPLDIVCSVCDLSSDVSLQLQYDSNIYLLLRYKTKIINIEDKIADMIVFLSHALHDPYDLNKNDNNIKLISELESNIDYILNITQNINRKITYFVNNNNVLQSNSDPIETLNSLIDNFNIQHPNFKSKLQINNLYIDVNKSNNRETIKHLEKINNDCNNIILNCRDILITHQDNNKKLILNRNRLNDFINKICNKQGYIVKSKKTILSLSAILVAFFDTTDNNTFHHASIVKINNNKWLFIDSDKQYNKDSEITLYNSIQEIFNQDNLTTQYIPDNYLNNSIVLNNNNIRKYNLVPVLIFYKNNSPNTYKTNHTQLFNPNKENDIKQYNITTNHIIESYIKDLKNIKNSADELQSKTNDITNKKDNKIQLIQNSNEILNNSILNKKTNRENFEEDQINYKFFENDDKIYNIHGIHCNYDIKINTNDNKFNNKKDKNYNINNINENDIINDDDFINIMQIEHNKISSNNDKQIDNQYDDLLDDKI